MARERVQGAEAMACVRFGRNRVHHQLSDALVLDEANGQTLPADWPIVFFSWVWRPVSELPPGD